MRGCGRILAPGQWWHFCGETDMGQTLPVLCTYCGGDYIPKKETFMSKQDAYKRKQQLEREIAEIDKFLQKEDIYELNP